MENKLNILHLTLKKKWFDLIASGQKTIEYREMKLYWIRRLIGKNFDCIEFRNGYGKDVPKLTIELKEKALRTGEQILSDSISIFRPKNGEEISIDKEYILLILGKVIK